MMTSLRYLTEINYSSKRSWRATAKAVTNNCAIKSGGRPAMERRFGVEIALHEQGRNTLRAVNNK